MNRDNLRVYESRDCARVRRLLDDFLSGELTIETSRDILAHIQTCDSCREEEDLRQRFRAALQKGWRAREIPAGLHRKIREGLADRGLSWPSLVRLAAGVAVAGAAVTVFALLGTEGTLFAVNHYAEVAQDHIECKGVVQPVSVRLPLDGVRRRLEEALSRSSGETVSLLERRRCRSAGADLLHYVFTSSNQHFSLILEERSFLQSLSLNGSEERAGVDGVTVYASRQGQVALAFFETDEHFSYLIGPGLDTARALRMARAIVPAVLNAAPAEL